MPIVKKADVVVVGDLRRARQNCMVRVSRRGTIIGGVWGCLGIMSRVTEIQVVRYFIPVPSVLSRSGSGGLERGEF